MLLDHPTSGDFWDRWLPVGREGGIEQRAVNRREAWALSFQGEAIVEDFWVAPGPGMYKRQARSYQLSSVFTRWDHWGKFEQSWNAIILPWAFGLEGFLNHLYLVVAQNQECPGKHDGHAEEEDHEDDDHSDSGHNSVALLDVIVKVLTIAEFIAVTVRHLEFWS